MPSTCGCHTIAVAVTYEIQPALLRFRVALQAEVESLFVAGPVSLQNPDDLQAIRGLLSRLSTQVRNRQPLDRTTPYR